MGGHLLQRYELRMLLFNVLVGFVKVQSGFSYHVFTEPGEYCVFLYSKDML